MNKKGKCYDKKEQDGAAFIKLLNPEIKGKILLNNRELKKK